MKWEGGEVVQWEVKNYSAEDGDGGGERREDRQKIS